VRLSTCPTATIHAPPDVVWLLLTDPAEYAHWGLHVGSVDPPRLAHAGQRIELQDRALGRSFPVTVELRDVRESPHRALRLDVRLPFGVVNRELITCATLSEDACFVVFN